MDAPLQVGGLIRVLRGMKVILDHDLAGLYAVPNKVLKRAVRRNRSRFPEDFMFQITFEEHRILRCQIGALSHGTHPKYPPLAFTEQGVAMLSGVLHSPRAVRVNVAIMRAFVRLREAAAAHGELVRRLAELEGVLTEHGSQLGEHARLIQEGFEAIRGLMEAPEPREKHIGFRRPGEAPGPIRGSGRIRRAEKSRHPEEP